MRRDVLVGYRVDWAYNDGDRGYHDTKGFGPDEYAQAADLCDRLNREPDTVAYLWPLENEVVVTAGASAEARRAVDLCRAAEQARGVVFETALRDLVARVRTVRDTLEQVGDDRETAEAEEVLADLGIVRTPDDLVHAGVLVALQAMSRRLAQ